MQSDLPVASVAVELAEALVKNGSAVLTAPPGSGKSTWLPLLLLNKEVASGKKILMLEPRRLAAVAVAARLAEHLNERPGQTIGYRIRLDSKVSEQTRIEIITEGVLTRLLQMDSFLEDYGLVIFDEFHERSIQTDLGLAFVYDILRSVRPELRILIMSATIDAEKVASYLGQCPIFRAEGKLFPVDVRYEPPEPGEFVVQHVIRIIRKVIKVEYGDVLVFLPGQGEIRAVQKGLEGLPENYLVLPLYGDMNIADQRATINPDPTGIRRIILSTSIAETSLTIDGLRLVIDSGLSRISNYHPGRGLARLETVNVSMDAAVQRSGRAGRTGPGICYRLWSKVTEASFRLQRRAEIETTDLANCYLEVIHWTGNRSDKFPWFDRPPQALWNVAQNLLIAIGAINEYGLTSTGRKLLRYPLHPRLAMMIIKAEPEYKSIAAMLAVLLSGRDIQRNALTVDIRERLYILFGRKNTESIRFMHAQMKQLLMLTDDVLPVQKTDPDCCGSLLLLAYSERLAHRTGAGSYRQVNGTPLIVDRQDEINEHEWIVAPLTDGKAGRQQVLLAAPVEQSLLKSHIEKKVFVGYDDTQEKIVAEQREQIGAILLSTTVLHKLSPDELMATWKLEIEKRGLQWACADKRFNALRCRIASMRTWRPDEAWPDVSDDALISSLSTWLTPFLANAVSFHDLGKVNFAACLMQVLDWEKQNRLETLVPLFIEVPSGSEIPVMYSMDGSFPRISVRLQELFGMFESPKVNAGRTGVLIELLSPGYKPVQLTNDLKSFWTSTYFEVRKELRSRYPKHYWPEDPLEAKGIRGTKKQNGMK